MPKKRAARCSSLRRNLSDSFPASAHRGPCPAFSRRPKRHWRLTCVLATPGRHQIRSRHRLHRKPMPGQGPGAGFLNKRRARQCTLPGRQALTRAMPTRQQKGGVVFRGGRFPRRSALLQRQIERAFGHTQDQESTKWPHSWQKPHVSRDDSDRLRTGSLRRFKTRLPPGGRKDVMWVTRNGPSEQRKPILRAVDRATKSQCHVLPTGSWGDLTGRGDPPHCQAGRGQRYLAQVLQCSPHVSHEDNDFHISVIRNR